MTATVVVIGGGYGGASAAKALDDVADVVLVEPKDRFVHHVGALRGLVEPEFADQLFLPYDRLLQRGRVVRDHAVAADAGAVTLGSGERLEADYLVLATGASYPFPAKFADHDTEAAKAKLRAAHDELAGAASVLLLGAGPVGLELAGEIKAKWPEKAVTIVDPAPELVPGFPQEFRASVREQLEELGVELLLGTSVETPPAEGGFTVATADGTKITADLWFRCFGNVPATGYLTGALAAARQPDGRVEVTPDLRLAGQEKVFAIGDITAVPEAKMARAAAEHAEVVAANIRVLIQGDGELATYEAAPPGMALPLGPHKGATYTLESGLLDAATTSQIKGTDLMVGRFVTLLGLG
ncbi:FAD-dependent oxidoreductase [Saccharothrix sp. AJ9571]|nr:FAD-dependent oxidoreductase [Saccharothrix sp. AJ9571]